jgi:hypothetical protein
MRTTTDASRQSLALKDILKQHLGAYMEHLFYLPCLGFLHPASTLQAIEVGLSPFALSMVDD